MLVRLCLIVLEGTRTRPAGAVGPGGDPGGGGLPDISCDPSRLCSPCTSITRRFEALSLSVLAESTRAALGTALRSCGTGIFWRSCKPTERTQLPHDYGREAKG